MRWLRWVVAAWAVVCLVCIIYVIVVTLAWGQTCERTPAPIVVDQDGAVILHARAAIHQGAPTLLTLARRGAAQRRRVALRGVSTRPGFDRDEYPPAISLQGGVGADVELVPSSVNRAQGASMRVQLSPYCDGQQFIFYDLPG